MSGPYTELQIPKSLAEILGAGYFGNIRPGLSGLMNIFAAAF
jgi:hypothetical protein